MQGPLIGKVDNQVFAAAFNSQYLAAHNGFQMFQFKVAGRLLDDLPVKHFSQIHGCSKYCVSFRHRSAFPCAGSPSMLL